MTTKLKREINLILLTDTKGLIDYMNSLSPEFFVSQHQDSFKDFYLGEPKMIFDNEIFNDLDLYDVIADKYREFFKEKGLDESHKWLNTSLYNESWSDSFRTEDITKNAIAYELGLDCDMDFDEEEAYHYFSELYCETWSGWGISDFVYNMIVNYIDSKNELKTLEQVLEEDEDFNLTF
jgi:hypothetical protein